MYIRHLAGVRHLTVRGIIGPRRGPSEIWVTHKYTKSSGRLANATKRRSEDRCARKRGRPSKNYITPDGLQRLKDEHVCPTEARAARSGKVVAWAASNGDRQ